MAERRRGGANTMLPLVKGITIAEAGGFNITLRHGMASRAFPVAVHEFNGLDGETSHIKRRGIGGRQRVKEAEYKKLGELHAIVPEYMVRPVGAIWNARHQFVGYMMEKVRGSDLFEFVWGGHSRDKIDYVERQLRDFGRRIHAAGQYHGDLTQLNIMLRRSYRIAVIDPLVKKESLYLEMVRRDNGRITHHIAMLEGMKRCKDAGR